MKKYKPMLARSAQAPFTSKDWIFEVKWDGIRAISYVSEELSVRSRNQKELIDNFPELSELKDRTRDTVLDGEIIIMKDGKVGTGFSGEFMEKLKRSLDEYIVQEETLQGVERDREITWLKAGVVCEVGYQAITEDGKLRIPVFQKIREDKDPLECNIDQIRPALYDYKAMRDFSKTPEPPALVEKNIGGSFVVQEHHARRLHYDLRLEKDGVLKSWAVPKGIPEISGDRRLAVQVEDHPLEYGKFQGTIPEGQYGAGTVKIWDRGLYEPIVWEEDKIEFIAKGEKMEGRYVLVKFKKAGEKNWLLFKGSD